MNETELMNCVRLRLSELGFAVFRANVGKVRMTDGRYFDTGLPKGFSDLFAVKNGMIYFIETKVKPNRPTKEQMHFLDVMSSRYGCAGGVAYSVEDAERICGVYDS